MSPTARVLLVVSVAAVAKIVTLKTLGHAARKQELKYTPKWRKPTS